MSHPTDTTGRAGDEAEVVRRLRATMALRADDMPPAGELPPGALRLRSLPPPAAADAGAGRARPRRRALAVAAGLLVAGGAAAAVATAGRPGSPSRPAPTTATGPRARPPTR